MAPLAPGHQHGSSRLEQAGDEQQLLECPPLTAAHWTWWGGGAWICCPACCSEGMGEARAAGRAHCRCSTATAFNCSPFRKWPGGGLALRRQSSQCQVPPGSGLSPARSVEPIGNVSQVEANGAAFKAQPGKGLQHSTLNQPIHPGREAPVPGVHCCSSCMHLLPTLLQVFQGRKAPGCFSPTW